MKETDIIALGVLEQLKKDLPNPTVMCVKTPPTGNYDVVRYALGFATEVNKFNTTIDFLVHDSVFTIRYMYDHNYTPGYCEYELADPAFPDNMISGIISYILDHHYPIPTIRQKDMDAHKSLIKGITEQLRDAVLENYSNMVLRPTYTIDPKDWQFKTKWEFITETAAEDEILLTLYTHINSGQLIILNSFLARTQKSYPHTYYELANPAFPQNLIADIIRRLEPYMLVE